MKHILNLIYIFLKKINILLSFYEYYIIIIKK